MSNEEDYKVVEAMETFGGSFVKALADCFRAADSRNYALLKATFANYWETYTEMAGKLDEKNPGHDALMLDIELLRKDAADYEFDDFKSEKYSAPKSALYNRAHAIAEDSAKGKYDQKF